jgi:hypothetical protein
MTKTTPELDHLLVNGHSATSIQITTPLATIVASLHAARFTVKGFTQTKNAGVSPTRKPWVVLFVFRLCSFQRVYSQLVICYTRV